jgi:tRNA dimethylallyltransferase
MKKIKIICVVGATASGKTSLGVELAKALDGEIISADSMQVYKNMSIATAAATKEEQQNIPHHLLEFLDSSEIFSVAEFVKLAREKIFDISSRGKVPIIVGGTGLFVDSLVQNINFADVDANDELRNRLNQKSADELYDELLSVDSNAAKAIHKNNTKRVIRALELYYGGVSKTQQNENSKLGENPFDAIYIGINYKDREVLYNRINRRVDIMVDSGLIDEAKQFATNSGLTSRQAIGHKELKPYFDNEITLDEAIENIKKGTRHYAKRQLTWFRRNDKINWLYADEIGSEELIDKAVALSKEFLQNN